MLYILALVLVLGILGLLLLVLLKPSEKPSSGTIRYVRRELLTPTELQFHARLREALPAHLVAPQVAMSALVDAVQPVDGSRSPHQLRAKVSQKRLDFVVVEPASGKVVCVVELDDHTHDRAARAKSDRARDAILSSVGLRVLRFDARTMPSVEALRDAVVTAS